MAYQKADRKNDHSKRISFFRTAISPRRLLAQPMKQSVLPILSRLQRESLVSPCSAVLHRPLARSAHWRPNLSAIGEAGAAANLASPRSLPIRLFPTCHLIGTFPVTARTPRHLWRSRQCSLAGPSAPKLSLIRKLLQPGIAADRLYLRGTCLRFSAAGAALVCGYRSISPCCGT